MADSHDAADRTEEPSAKRLQDARERGQVARSRELGTAAVMITGSAALFAAGGSLAGGFGRLLGRALALDRATLLDPAAMGRLLGAATLEGLLLAAPVLAAVLVAAVLAPLALGGWVFSPRAFAPSLERLNPLTGLGRVFGWNGAVELAKALLKVVVVGAIAIALGFALVRDTVALGSLPTLPGMGRALHLLGLALLLMSAGLVLIAGVDAPFQWWYHRRQLKMTREELQQEHKETDGRPEVKQRVRELQRKFSKRRMMRDVPLADVVVTNPTHYAVALKYDAGRMRAPRVLAKGRDLVALEIGRLATASNVPLFESPPLARVLYGSTEVGREIPPGLYLAVAQVLSYVYQLRTRSPALAARLRRPTPVVDAELRDRYDRGGVDA